MTAFPKNGDSIVENRSPIRCRTFTAVANPLFSASRDGLRCARILVIVVQIRAHSIVFVVGVVDTCLRMRSFRISIQCIEMPKSFDRQTGKESGREGGILEYSGCKANMSADDIDDAFWRLRASASESCSDLLID